METYKCIRCGKVFEGYLLDGMYTCDYCDGELYTGEFYIDKVKEGNSMNFIEAIGKYGAITRDGGTNIYYKNSEGNIIKKVNGIEGGFQLNYDLLISTGWEEYKEHKLILPERVSGEYGRYDYIDNSKGQIKNVKDYMYNTDDARFKNFNYFTDSKLAQYIADKQLIDRVYLVLEVLNENRFNTLDRLELIDTYIDKNYKEVLDRIDEYEINNRVQY